MTHVNMTPLSSKSKGISIIFLISLLIGAGYYLYPKLFNASNTTASSRPTRSIPVRADRVAVNKVSETLVRVGNLKASQSIDITTEVSGRIAKVFVNTDQLLEKGAPLFDLDDGKAKAALDEAKAYAADEERKYNDLAKLRQKAAISQTELDSQRTSALIAKARLDAAQSTFEDHHIKTPFKGKVGFVDLTNGQLVSVGTKLLNFDNTRIMFLDLSIPERYLPMLTKGQKVSAFSYSWPNELFEGEIEAIDSRINEDSLTLKVRVAFKNHQYKLRPGMLMSATLLLPEKEEPMIPVQAIEYSGSKRYVYRIDENNIAKRQQVILGARIKNNIVIDSGLTIGDRIIVEGLVSIHDGSKVNLLEDKTKTVESTESSRATPDPKGAK